MFRRLFAWMSKHERSLSAAAMIAGFIVDQIFFGRVDVWQTQTVFAVYVIACFISIPLLHRIETQAEAGRARPRWRPVVPLVTQFALGGFWSGFLFFYGRAAVLGASWPFLTVLAVILIANEVLKKYHDRLVFTSVLFFFALLSYSIFEVPIFVGSISTVVFIESGVAAVLAFAAFTGLLRLAGRTRFMHDVWRIRLGALAVLVIINFFYFTNILPPLPLAAKDAGIYYGIKKTGDVYTATEAKLPWYRVTLAPFFGPPTLTVVPGESLYAFSAVYAPVKLSTIIIHQWQYFDPKEKAWITRAAISFPISGGRDGGYRGFSAKANLDAGQWRVNVETADGRLISQIPFTVALSATPPEGEPVTLP